MSVHEDLLNNGENNCSFTEDEVDIMCSKDGDAACGDGMSSVTKQVKKYRNRLKIRDSERFAAFGSLPESLFSCFDNSVIVCLLIG